MCAASLINRNESDPREKGKTEIHLRGIRGTSGASYRKLLINSHRRKRSYTAALSSRKNASIQTVRLISKRVSGEPNTSQERKRERESGEKGSDK